MVYYSITTRSNLFLFCLLIMQPTLLLSSFFPMTRFVYEIDPLIAQQVRQDISNYIDQLPDKQNFSFRKLAKKIEKKFPFIKETTIEHIAPNVVFITCNTQKPIALINNALILTAQEGLYNKNIFLSLITDQLPSIIIPALEKDIVKSLAMVIKNIDPVILSEFTLSWLDDTKIYLYDKKYTQFSVIFNKNQLPDKKLISYCTQIKQKLQTQMTNNNKKNYIADIRFKDQIVVYRG